MSAPTVTLSPTSGPAGTLVTVTVTRDVPVQPIDTAATTAGGTGHAAFNLVEALSVATTPNRTLTPVSDSGTVAVYTFTA